MAEGTVPVLLAIADDVPTLRIAIDRDDRSVGADCSRRYRPLTQPFVEDLAVDHADEAAVDRHVDAAVGRRDHARRPDFAGQ